MTSPTSAEALYQLSEHLRDVRRQLVVKVMDNQKTGTGLVDELKAGLSALRNIRQLNGKPYLDTLSGRKLVIQVNEEILSLEKDILFLEKGEDALIHRMDNDILNYRKQVDQVVSFLKNRKVSMLISDRDGTLNVSSERYWTSVQPLYSAVFTGRFIIKQNIMPLIISSAPLQNYGLLDMVTDKKGLWNYSASNGIQCVNLSGSYSQLSVYPEWENVFDTLNNSLQAILGEPEFSSFRYTGNGCQQWFLFTAVTYQDQQMTIPEHLSQTFYSRIRDTMRNADPSGRYLQFTSDNKTIFIAPRIQRMINLDKAYGLKYLIQTLNLGLEEAVPLVCGDNKQDLSMLGECVARNPHTVAVFVTTDPALKSKVSGICFNSVFVTCPDILLSSLAVLSQL